MPLPQPQAPRQAPKRKPNPNAEIIPPFQMEPGEHVSITGQTGSGKSTAAEAILNRAPLNHQTGSGSRLRLYKLMLRSKRDDVVYRFDKKIKHASGMDDTRYKSFELWPSLHAHPYEFWRALEKAYKQGSWTVYVDELLRIDRYGLREHVENLLTQGRSLGISVFVGMQRPAHVSRFALSESSHVISFGHEGRDAKTLAESTTPRIFNVVENLQRHEFVWFHRPTRQFWQGFIQELEKGVPQQNVK